MFFKTKQPEYLLVGLGNPGPQYSGTRHNLGFMALEYIAGQKNVQVTKAKFSALYGQGDILGRQVLFFKPQTFMNLSGKAVAAAAAYYKIPAEKCIIIFDDTSLPPGKIRVREKGSAGGHNGVKSVISVLGEEFPRVKIGVGNKPHPAMDLAEYVLGKPKKEDLAAIEERFGDVLLAVEGIIEGDLKLVMGRFNGEKSIL